MSVDADILRRLAALELPKEAFQEVLSILADVQAKSEARRKAAQERTAKWREGKNKRHGDTTVTSPERHGNSHDPSYLSSSGKQERKEGEALESGRARSAPRVPKPAAGVVIRFDTPQARAWERHHGKPFVWGLRGERVVPTEWPPGHDPPLANGASAEHATQPEKSA